MSEIDYAAVLTDLENRRFLQQSVIVLLFSHRHDAFCPIVYNLAIAL